MPAHRGRAVIAALEDVEAGGFVVAAALEQVLACNVFVSVPQLMLRKSTFP